MIDEPRSPLPLVTFDNQTEWNDLLPLCNRYLDEAGLRRLNSCLGVVRTVVIERHYIDKDYRDTFSNYHSKRFSTPPSRCLRLHFFDEPITRDQLRSAEQIQSSYCGYSIIRPTRPNCIGRTLLDPRKLQYPTGDLCTCEETLSIQGVILDVHGFPFISQDADVTVCAQSALWMVLRFFSNRYRPYREIYPVEITQLTRDYSIGRMFPSAGLTNWQMAEVLRQLGFSPLQYSREGYQDQFEHILATYVESGVPVLAATRKHVVACLGRSHDLQKQLPPGFNQPYLKSSFFNTAYTINDDNGIPYQLLRVDNQAAVAPMLPLSRLQLKEIEAFTCPLPQRVFLSAEQLEVVVLELLRNTDFRIEICSPTLAQGTFVIRTFLTTGRSFKRYLDDRGMGHQTVYKVYRNMPLPHFIWVCELSSIDLFRQQRIVGEVIWDATRNVYEPSGWLALHYPERLYVDYGSALNRARSLRDFNLDKSTDYPLMTHNLRAT